MTGSSFAAATALLAVLGLGSSSRSEPSGIAITDVTVVDVVTGSAVSHQTVLIAGRTITAVGPSLTTRVPAGFREVKGAGKFLIPGLWDMHVHLSMIGRSSLALFLANGITGVRDMGGDPDMVLALRDSVAAGTVVGPRIKAPGKIVESGRWLRNVIGRVEKLDQPELLAELKRRFPLDSVADGPRVVDSLVQARVDFIKIRNYPGPAAYAAFAAAAKQRGLRIAGHAPLVEMLGLVSDSGFASFEHSLIGVRGGKLIDAFDGMPDSTRRALLAKLAANGTAWDPTLVSTQARFIPDTAIARMIDDSTGATDPILKYVSPTLRQSWRAARALASVSSNDDWTAIYQANLAEVRLMYDAGVRLLAGTDVAVTSLVPGYSLHDELELMVSKGGLTPGEALATATINPARVLRLDDSLGTVAAGRIADLVLLEADPLADVKATRAVRAVIANGRWLEGRELEKRVGN
jgi:imidazolonepropionase-like amidohydrolase